MCIPRFTVAFPSTLSHSCIGKLLRGTEPLTSYFDQGPLAFLRLGGIGLID